ncbi:hypothetical protein BU17DRAFT_89000 [Hysterangium stoloniferum]|nr:hypothetical protein BU17DRAFT_89000 [Hysterangium stoloniferum]
MPSTNIPLFQLPHNEVSSYDHRSKQAQINELECEVSELKRQLAAAIHVAAISMNNCSKSTTINASATTTVPVNGVTTQGRDKLTDRICQLAGKFTILYVLWIGNIEELFKTTVDPKYQLVHRFNSQCDHSWITNSYFQTQFNEGMSQAHSDAVAHVCHICGPHLFNISDVADFARHDWREIHCRELIGWVQTDNGEIYYKPFAPIPYHNYHGKVDIYKLFLNPVLIQVYKSIVHGQGSLDQPNHLRGVKESRWGISEITPGAIAMTGICARFALSHDPQFQCQGSATCIDYEVDFQTYLEFLLVDNGIIKNIFSFWNQELYSVATKSTIFMLQKLKNSVKTVLAELKSASLHPMPLSMAIADPFSTPPLPSINPPVSPPIPSEPHPHRAPTLETSPGIIDDPPLAHCSESHMSGVPCAENFPSTEEAMVVASRKVGKEKLQLRAKAIRMTRRTKAGN